MVGTKVARRNRWNLFDPQALILYDQIEALRFATETL